MEKRVRYFLIFLWLLLAFTACDKGPSEIPSLIPRPQSIEWNNKHFPLHQSEKEIEKRIVDFLPGVPFHENEAYILRVNADSAILLAATETGLFRGMQTVRQLIREIDGKEYLAGCSITDWPAFAIRGFMQDVGRNYQSLPMLKEQIDVLAAYKYNVFHFHVTDYPGWRLESLIYPELKEPRTMSRWPGMYYSQDEFLELVNYCHERHITLIPEFDLPGHSTAFLEAFGLDSMSDPRVQGIIINLIDEVCHLIPAGKMPWFHIGTDEVWHRHQKPAPGLLEAIVQRLGQHGREVIVWRPGEEIAGDSLSITQLWSSNGKPKPGHRYIDSRLNYLNHLDPLAGIPQLYYDRINLSGHGDSVRLGGILCCWNDNNVHHEYDIIRHNPVYPGILTYGETAWKGQPFDTGDDFLARFPEAGHPLFQEFVEFEKRLTDHRDKFFRDKPFPYVKQTNIQWKIIGPFSHDGNPDGVFPVEEAIRDRYIVDGKEYRWTGPYYGGTVHVRHFFDFPSYFDDKEGTVYAFTRIWSPAVQTVDCWIGFHDWSRSGGRRGGPFPLQGQWHNTNPKVWVNDQIIHPPDWKNPGKEVNSEEVPFEDENYYFREPAKIILNKGWNNILLKVPQGGSSWKWMFTFVPVHLENGSVSEIQNLKYSIN